MASRTPRRPASEAVPAASAPRPAGAEPESGGRSSAEAASEIALLGEGDIGAAELTRRLADNIRTLRKARGYSLDDMARRSGVSRASLSQVETAKTNPTIAILWKIAAGLEVPFSALLGADKTERVSVLRRPDQRVLRSADGQLESRPLTPAGTLGGVEVYELRLAPRAVHSSEPHAPGTGESVTVLVGHCACASPRRSTTSPPATPPASPPTSRTATRTRAAPTRWSTT
ncbi:helix-turn-helix domain-containing protein [Nannocystis pusilla]|uniref:Helix-turn-helix domain-containing protein n=1 Tax=Nannocystis pusilla TaxID=889268 RepID=A0A9X3EX91_9BACT|nr:helix-turn-helix domain-containing protein [Nannocystis pusilla]MCY1011872.1 helix-turn-helix domain-containing protein [Nannocystis pusilla]